jgi:hypothetical protein
MNCHLLSLDGTTIDVTAIAGTFIAMDELPSFTIDSTVAAADVYSIGNSFGLL